jgi:hypothetical protein
LMSARNHASRIELALIGSTQRIVLRRCSLRTRAPRTPLRGGGLPRSESGRG